MVDCWETVQKDVGLEEIRGGHRWIGGGAMVLVAPTGPTKNLISEKFDMLAVVSSVSALARGSDSPLDIFFCGFPESRW